MTQTQFLPMDSNYHGILAANGVSMDTSEKKSKSIEIRDRQFKFCLIKCFPTDFGPKAPNYTKHFLFGLKSEAAIWPQMSA